MKTILKKSGLLAIIFFAIVSFTQAQGNPFDIQFPIAELGGCGSANECKLYCDDAENMNACISWAEDNGFSAKRSDDDRRDEHAGKDDSKFEDAITNGGPGGCDSLRSCDVFCSQTENNDECFAFARDNDLIPQHELERIENERIEEHRVGPGGCDSRQSCDDFCRNPENTETCLLFAVDEGDITQEDADYLLKRMESFDEHSQSDDFGRGPRVGGPRGPRGGPREHVGPDGPEIDEEKARLLLETTSGPGGCSGMDECELFCSTPGNDEVCMAFAIEHDLVSTENIERMQKMMNMTGPGGCSGRECEIFCSDEDNAKECLAFAIEHDFISEEEAEHAQKFMDVVGPGGCRGRECEEYCRGPEHGEECFSFVKDNGLIPEDELEMLEREMEILRKLERGRGSGWVSWRI